MNGNIKNLVKSLHQWGDNMWGKLIVFALITSCLLGGLYIMGQEEMNRYIKNNEQEVNNYNINNRLSILEKNVNDYLGKDISTKDNNEFIERINNLNFLIPNADKQLLQKVGGTYYSQIAYISLYVYKQPSSVGCSMAMHEIGHHRWYTELSIQEQTGWNNDTEAYARWFSDQFPCDTNKKRS